MWLNILQTLALRQNFMGVLLLGFTLHGWFLSVSGNSDEVIMNEQRPAASCNHHGRPL
jgi:hypothetical protein